MSDERCITLLNALRPNELERELRELEINIDKILLVNRIASAHTADVPISVDFIVFLVSNGLTHSKIQDTKDVITRILSESPAAFYTFCVHTTTSFKAYLLENKLCNNDDIDAYLLKATSLDQLVEQHCSSDYGRTMRCGM